MAQVDPNPKPNDNNNLVKKKKKKTDKLKLQLECNASAEMMQKIFTMKEARFLTALFYGQLKKIDDKYVIGDNQSFEFKITKELITDDDEYKVFWLLKKKEWAQDEWSKVKFVFVDDDDIDKRCDLEFKHSLIPLNDKHGNPDQCENMKFFWKQTVFKGLTQFGNISCKEKK